MIGALQPRERPPWTIDLRRCQREAIAAWLPSTPADALLEITPGGGKSIIIARLAHAMLSTGRVARVLPIVPTDYLRTQLTGLLQSVGVNVTEEYRASWGLLPAHYDGVVATYQQVAAEPQTFARIAVNAFVPLDEIHHAAAHATWGQALQIAFTPARHRLLLTGTPFRDDEARVSFVPYRVGEAQALYRYSYLDALRDGVVRPVQFEIFGAKIKWRSHDGAERESETSAPVMGDDDASERLRALLWSDEWIEKVLRAAHDRLREIRITEQPNAAGLVAAIDMAHARHVARILGSITGQMPVVVLSDDPLSGKKIENFRAGDQPWIVAVRQVSEGVDIPRVRIPVFMTNITTRLFFKQFIPRALRYQADVGGEQMATAYLPEDPRLLAYAHTFTEAVRAWAKDKAIGSQVPGLPTFTGGGTIESKFAVLETDSYMAGTVRPTAGESATASLPPPAPSPMSRGPMLEGSTRLDPASIAQMREQREEVNRLVAALSKATGAHHGKIHGLLKRRCGSTLEQANPAQLQARLRQLATWLRRGRIG